MTILRRRGAVNRRARGAPVADAAPRARARNTPAPMRWPAVMVLGAAVVSMLVIGRGDGADAGPGARTRPMMAAAGDDAGLASTWYCAAGTVGVDGEAAHEVVLANPTGGPAEATLTVHPVVGPPPIDLDAEVESDVLSGETIVAPSARILPPVTRVVSVPALSTVRIPVSDAVPDTATDAAVLIEADIGSLVVEHRLSGPSGAAQSPCASSSASSWSFAAGTTRRNARQILSVFNPFPSDAVVDITFSVDGSLRSPQIFDGLVVASGSVLPVDISGVVTLFDVVSAQLQVRTGRVVADRQLIVTGDDSSPGLTVSTGALRSEGTWVFPASSPAGATDAIVVTNPSADLDAVVDVEIRLDRPEDNGFVEPVTVTIRPGRSEVVALGDPTLVSAGRIVDASDRIPADVDHWIAVRSVNGIEVGAERMTFGAAGAAVASGVGTGLPAAATRHYVGTGDGVGVVSIVNPAADRIAGLSLEVYHDGIRYTVTDAEVSPLGIVHLDFASLGLPADALLVIESTQAVYVERQLSLGGAPMTSAPSIPAAGTLSQPALPIDDVAAIGADRDTDSVVPAD